jgi:hypothetical protein
VQDIYLEPRSSTEPYLKPDNRTVKHDSNMLNSVAVLSVTHDFASPKEFKRAPLTLAKPRYFLKAA